jgi:UDP-N-acetylglucosamine 2-epimerase
MTQPRIMTIVGTRPEVIRLSRVIALLDQHTDHLLVHTGQNYDYELNDIFFQQLDLRKPDAFMNIDTSTLGSAVGDIIKQSEILLDRYQPEALLVLGDTNSCLSAYMAKRKHIPVFHMEAGNRSYDFNVPEEINRRIIDHIADYNLVYTEHARRHLISEGLPHRRIYLTGSPMFEVLHFYRKKIDSSTILNDLNLTEEQYFLASFHREENVDNPQNLSQILRIMKLLAGQNKIPVIVSTHPRTKKRIEANNTSSDNKNIRFLKPFGFLDYIKLQQNAKCVISDSGTISEESAILSFPAISLRQSMERPEAQDSGTIILSGLKPQVVLSSIAATIQHHRSKKENHHIPADYMIANTSWRVLKLILGNTGLSNKWHGI